MSLEWDPKKAKLNLRKHGVRVADAALGLEDDRALAAAEDSADGEERWVTLGMDGFGRLLVVVYTWRASSIRLISARARDGQRAETVCGDAMKKEYDFSKARRGP